MTDQLQQDDYVNHGQLFTDSDLEISGSSVIDQLGNSSVSKFAEAQKGLNDPLGIIILVALPRDGRQFKLACMGN